MNAPLTLRFHIQRIFRCGVLVAALALAGQHCRATTISDNTTGIFNGLLGAGANQWLAGRICVGAQPYTLDSVAFLLTSGDNNRPHVSTVRLQIYSDNPGSSRPAVSTGPMLNLTGLTNPITLPIGFADTLVTWTPAASFTLAANTCYWFVLSVDNGDVVYATVSQTQPTGDAGAFGWGPSFDAGVTWGAPDLFDNLKMLIQGTAIPTPLLVANLATAIPGGTGNFTSLPRGPSLSGSTVVFFGAGSGGQQGIYVQNPFIHSEAIRIADLTTLLTDGQGPIETLLGELQAAQAPIPGGSGDNAVFYAAGSGGQRGIYAYTNNTLWRVADTNTVIPGGSGSFTGFTRPGLAPSPTISGNNVAFYGESSGGQQGVYASINGSLTRIADTTTAIPGGTGSFTAIPVDPNLSGDGVAFMGNGSGGQQGIYRGALSGSLTKVADKNTAIPGGTGNFTSFIPGDPVIPGDPILPAIDGASVAFFGAGSGGQQGVYVMQHGPPIRVADTQTAIPGGIGSFTSFGAVSVSETDVAFLGVGTGGQTGIYGLTGSQLIKVIAVGDMISGKTVTGLNFTRGGLFGDPIAFQATFDDGSQALYTMAVVAPPFALRITGVSRLGNDLRLSFNSLAGTNYVIQSRTNLLSDSWAALPGTTNSGTGSVVPVTLTNAFTEPQRFYRVQQVP